MIVGLFGLLRETETLRRLCFQLRDSLIDLLVGFFFGKAILLLNFARQNVASAIDLQEFVVR